MMYQDMMWKNGEMGPLFLLGVVVELVLKGYALWHAARYSQKAWYIVLLVVNSLGILPLIYLIFFRPKEGAVAKKSLKKKK